MCLILFSYKSHPRYKLILASNRDEFYNRPTRQLELWDDEYSEAILAGRDEQGKGTWLGVTPSCKISGITNYRSMKNIKDQAPSRGLLVSNYLNGNLPPKDYLESVKTSGHLYNGFNLIAGDLNSMYYYSNIADEIQEVKPGIYGLSNAFLDTPWPKIRKGKSELARILSDDSKPTEESLFSLLADKEYPPQSELPDTGVGSEWEKILSPIFIESDIYGTRTSTLVTIDYNAGINVIEKTFIRSGIGELRSEILSKTLNVR